MSDLSAKFTSLESQLATQHTEITDDLEAILTALGAPPPGDLITLEDISGQLATISTDIAAIKTANDTFYSALADSFALLNTNIETILNNNSANTQALISAIYSTSCACPVPSAVLPLPIDVTPTSLEDEAKCRRIQFYLSVFGNWLTKIANYGSAAGFITGDTLGALLGLAVAEAGIVATGAEVGAAAGPPGLVVGAVIGLISGAIFTLGGSVLIDYANQFNDPVLRNDMVMAMFAATNADEGYTAFKTTLLANMSTIPAEIIYTLWWTAWSNDVYSGSPVVDDSAFDGSICAPPLEGCFTLSTELVTANIGTGDETTVGAIVWPDEFSPTNIAPNSGRTWSEATFTQIPLGTQLTIRQTTESGHEVTVHQCELDTTITFIGFAITTPLSYENTSSGSGLLIQSGGVTGVELEICFV